MVSDPDHNPSQSEATPSGGGPAAPPDAPKLFSRSAGQMRSNVLARLALFAVHVTTGLWLTPYLIGHLGLAMYGLVPLANQITSYMGIITVALTGAVGRYLTIELTRGDFAAANRTFNTSLFGGLMLAAGLLVPVAVVVATAPLFLTIPPGSEAQVRILLGGVMLAFLLAVDSYPFVSSCIACNRLDINSLIEAVYPALRVVAIIVLFNWLGPRPWEVGVSFAVGGVAMMAAGIVAWRHLTPQLYVSPRAFDRSRLRALTGMGGWLSMNSLGSLLFLNADLLVVNMVVGVEAGGAYGAVLQWSVLLRTMAGMLPALVYPNLLAAYAEGNLARLVSISKLSTKLLGLVLALPVGLICGLSYPLLHAWLGPSFAPLWQLLVLMTFHLAVNHATGPLLFTQMTYNKVRWMGIATLVLGCVNVSLAVLFAGPLHWGMYGVALAGAIVLTLRNAIVVPAYTARIMERPWLTFAGDTMVSALATALVAALAWFLSRHLNLMSLPRLAVVGAAVAAVYAAAAYYLGLSPAEERTLRQIVLARPAAAAAGSAGPTLGGDA